jgi:hypothetical protein
VAYAPNRVARLPEVEGLPYSGGSDDLPPQLCRGTPPCVPCMPYPVPDDSGHARGRAPTIPRRKRLRESQRRALRHLARPHLVIQRIRHARPYTSLSGNTSATLSPVTPASDARIRPLRVRIGAPGYRRPLYRAYKGLSGANAGLPSNAPPAAK